LRVAFVERVGDVGIGEGIERKQPKLLETVRDAPGDRPGLEMVLSIRRERLAVRTARGCIARGDEIVGRYLDATGGAGAGAMSRPAYVRDCVTE
jgi:hypothetical protein